VYDILSFFHVYNCHVSYTLSTDDTMLFCLFVYTLFIYLQHILIYTFCYPLFSVPDVCRETDLYKEFLLGSQSHLFIVFVFV